MRDKKTPQIISQDESARRHMGSGTLDDCYLEVGGSEADSKTGSGFDTTYLMERVVERFNMIKALTRVENNKGAAGVDGLKVEQLRQYLNRHWGQIKQRLLDGDYEPSQVRRVEIPKPDGGTRRLGIPTVLDRLIQQAIGQALDSIFDPHFSESSYGFRSGRSAHQALKQANRYAREEGLRVVVDIDLEKFFDRVNHDILMDRLARKIKDKRMLKLIRRYLESGAMVNGIEEASNEGTPQGGPLSPLLSNIMLDELDKELERRGHKFCRYADDCNIYVRSQKAGERVKVSITGWLKRKLKLKVNEEKSAVDLVSRRKFLGYSMTSEKKRPRLKPSKPSLLRLRTKLKELFRRGRGRNLGRFIKEDLNPVIRGWANYFSLSETHTIFRDLDWWIRRRLRAMIWRQWKTPWNRYKQLLLRGAQPEVAQASAYNGRGPWWNSGGSHMDRAIPNNYFDQLGLVSLKYQIQRMANAS